MSDTEAKVAAHFELDRKKRMKGYVPVGKCGNPGNSAVLQRLDGSAQIGCHRHRAAIIADRLPLGGGDLLDGFV